MIQPAEPSVADAAPSKLRERYKEAGLPEGPGLINCGMDARTSRGGAASRRRAFFSRAAGPRIQTSRPISAYSGR